MSDFFKCVTLPACLVKVVKAVSFVVRPNLACLREFLLPPHLPILIQLLFYTINSQLVSVVDKIAPKNTN